MIDVRCLWYFRVIIVLIYGTRGERNIRRASRGKVNLVDITIPTNSEFLRPPAGEKRQIIATSAGDVIKCQTRGGFEVESKRRVSVVGLHKQFFFPSLSLDIQSL